MTPARVQAWLRAGWVSLWVVLFARRMWAHVQAARAERRSAHTSHEEIFGLSVEDGAHPRAVVAGMEEHADFDAWRAVEAEHPFGRPRVPVDPAQRHGAAVRALLRHV